VKDFRPFADRPAIQTFDGMLEWINGPEWPATTGQTVIIFNIIFIDADMSANASLALRRLDELQASPLRVLYRRGVVYCERTLSALPPERLANVTTTSQALKMLLAGRADVYCDIDSSMRQAQSEEQIRVPAVRMLLELESAALYPYLHARHAELAPRLAAVLKRMKEEGLLDRYLREVPRDGELK
jgi:hypothetical protein